jgi:hypothetical protein
MVDFVREREGCRLTARRILTLITIVIRTICFTELTLTPLNSLSQLPKRKSHRDGSNPSSASITTMRRSRSGLVLWIHLLVSAKALTSPNSKATPNLPTLPTCWCQPRRSLLLSGLGGCLTAAALSLQPSPSPPLSTLPAFQHGSSNLAFVPRSAWAVQERNEALCGTGFFTNFMEYRCTELGDISDEGLPGALSDSQSERADALLSKFQLVDDAAVDPSGAGGGGGGKKSTAADAEEHGVPGVTATTARAQQQRR